MYRAMLLAAGIVAAVSLPTAEIELNITEAGESPLGRRVLPPKPTPTVVEAEDCPNFMWKLGKKDEGLCDWGEVQEWGMIVCYVLNVLIAIVLLIWWRDFYTKYVDAITSGCGPAATPWCTLDWLRLGCAFLFPLFFELHVMYLLFEVFYKTCGDCTTAKSPLVDTSGKNAQFNQGFPKIGPGDCRSSKYARVETNAC
jgi:hypothetical protein